MSRNETAVTHRRYVQAAMYQRWGFELKAEAHYESEQGNFDTWRLFKESHHSVGRRKMSFGVGAMPTLEHYVSI